jgi:hypothetical protein
VPRKPAKYPFTQQRAYKAAQVDVPSFTKGLVTLVPSESAGMIAAPQGAPQSTQAQTVQFGPDSKDAVVVASNMRFRDKATMNAPGYQPFGGVSLGSPINLIFFSQQLGSSVPMPGTFLILATSTDIYIGSPQ